MVFLPGEFWEGTGGLLRIPKLLRNVLNVIKDQQQYRSTSAPPSWSPYATMNDGYITAIIALSLFILRFALDKYCFSLLFRSYPKRIQRKLCENLFYSFYYIAAFCFFLFRVVPSIEWSADILSNDSQLVKQLIFPYPPDMVPSERHYYAQALGFYISASVFLVFFDSRRSDFAEICLHHLVTIGLVFVSYLYGYVRGGIIILAMHDIGDIFLYSAKLLHHLGKKGIDTLVFAIFAVTFYFTRLVMFPRLVHMITIEIFQSLLYEPALNNWAMFMDTYIIHYIFFVSFFSILQLLHCFWFTLILKMIYREMFLGASIADQGDIRSDDGNENKDGDEDEIDDLLKNKEQ